MKVAGPILNAMLPQMKRWGRVAACGAISGYNDKDPSKSCYTNYFEVISNRIKIEGFLCFDWDVQVASNELIKAYKEGKLDLKDTEMIVKASKLEDVPQIWYKAGSPGSASCIKLTLIAAFHRRQHGQAHHRRPRHAVGLSDVCRQRCQKSAFVIQAMSKADPADESRLTPSLLSTSTPEMALAPAPFAWTTRRCLSE